MIDYDGMRVAVCSGLKDYLGIPIARANQNEPPPSYDYLSYTITTLLSENNGTYGVYDDGTERKAYTQVWSLTSLSDDNSRSVLNAVKAREWLDRVGTTYLYDNNVVVQSVGSITNRDNFLTSEYEYRNGFDAVFLVYDEIGAGIVAGDGYIEEVAVNAAEEK